MEAGQPANAPRASRKPLPPSSKPAPGRRRARLAPHPLAWTGGNAIRRAKPPGPDRLRLVNAALLPTVLPCRFRFGFRSGEPCMRKPVYQHSPQHAQTTCAGPVGTIRMNEEASSNVPGRSQIQRRGITCAAWHCSTAKRARPWSEGAGDSGRCRVRRRHSRWLRPWYCTCCSRWHSGTRCSPPPSPWRKRIPIATGYCLSV